MYGLLISLGILASILIAEYLVKKDHKNTDIIWDLSGISITTGIIGARGYHVLSYWGYYSLNPIEILYIWNGGLGIYGAIILGCIAIVTYLKYKGLDTKNILYYISTIVTVMPLGQSIGRWGNFFNKELYGLETTLPWGIDIKGIKHHPLFLYESVATFILFLILMYLKIKRKVNPQVTIGVYLAGYGIIRFFWEYLKYEKDMWLINGINISQIVSIVFILISYILISKDKLPNDIHSK
jgi:phosphatidylglycerol---prolipoprotein diacylglyceryl transferase